MFVGIDIGTSGSKGVLVAADGRIVGRAALPHQVSRPRPGWAEHDAEGVWWHDFKAISHSLMESVRGARITGVGVSGLGPCVLPADSLGRPLRPAILYGIDSRATREIAELTEELGEKTVLETCGAPLTTQAVGPKLRWLLKHEPETHSRMRKVFSCSSYIVYRLTGSYVLDHSTASQFVPMYDLSTGNWQAEWSLRPDFGVELPRLAWPAEIVGEVTAATATDTGLPEGTPVTAGTLDACAESLSVGVRSVGDTMVMYGTTMVFVEIVDPARRPGGLWLTNGVLSGSRFLVGSVTTSGAVAAWVGRVTGVPVEVLMTEAASVPPGSRGLIVLPYFAGERTPFSNPNARGAIVGLTTSHTPADLYRAALEGAAYAARQNLALSSSKEIAQRRVVAVGGGTAGGLWVQIVSDVTGLPQDLPREAVGASLGDAMLAAISTGDVPDPWGWNPLVGRILPNYDRHSIYNEYFPYVSQLYGATREICDFLAAQQQRSPWTAS